MKFKRVFLIVLDSFGIGKAKDACKFGDEGANTLKTISENKEFSAENMKKLGLFNITGVDGEKNETCIGKYGRVQEISQGKDTTTGHWEIAGVISERPFPTYPEGFPKEIIEKFQQMTGRGILCNKPYSGTQVIADYGEEHIKTGKLIVYTSADSVFQIAAHENVVKTDELYRFCRIAREILKDEHSVARVIARPFGGEYPNFYRTPKRHDYSLEPTGETMLDILKSIGRDVIGVGKIYDIFAGKGLTEYTYTTDNAQGIEKTLEFIEKDFSGLCFVNLVDFDMKYGHRNDVEGYAEAISYFDRKLGEIIPKLLGEDVLIITADHGCDPGFPGTDHTREDVPLLLYSPGIEPGNLGIISGFHNIGKTVMKLLGVRNNLSGNSII